MASTSSRTAMRRFGTVKPSGGSIVVPDYHPASRGGRSIFPSRVFDPHELPRLLKSGHNSRKIGKLVTKGYRAGQPIYTLTLEERASCPRSCTEWGTCYGNNMQAAERIVHGPNLIASLECEVRALARQHPGGFLVRLHVLGDFWSVEYVQAWSKLLAHYPELGLFGFTAHTPLSPIGEAIGSLIDLYGWRRAAIRFSGAAGAMHAFRVLDAAQRDHQAILCPAQTGATDCCGTCALCWQSERSIAFRRH